jgi:phosphoglycerate dehydrogenase-like enzyme
VGAQAVKVAVLDDIHEAYDGTAGMRRLREHAEVRIFSAPFGDAVVLRGFDALVANRERTRFRRDLLEHLPDVRIIAQTGNHAHHIDLVAASERHIVVARASGGFSVGAAELAIALALALMRQIPTTSVAMAAGGWPIPMTQVLHAKTLGIVGLGRVGQHVARLGAAFGMRVLAWSPGLTDAAASAAGAERISLDELLAESDVVSVHAALTAGSRGLLDARRIGFMKSSAYLINTARGPIVDQAALAEALLNKRIAGAGLDVFDEEPLPPGHPLRSLSNVLLTPHIGWATDEGYARFSAAACDVLLAYQAGLDVPCFTL